MRAARKPGIMADAAYAIFAKPARELTGNFLIDDTFLAQNGRDRLRALPGGPDAEAGSGLFRSGR